VAQAEEIKAGRQKSMFKKLEERGYVHDVTGCALSFPADELSYRLLISSTREEVERMMTETRAGAYVGIDPTASSLHVGHMLPLMSLFWMYVHGYRTVTLIGGATATIGDPTDRLTTREKTDSSVRAKNMVSMHCQLENLWLNLEAYKKKYGYASERTWSRALYNNKTWWDTLPMLEVLQVLGPGMRMGSMLARDT
jgi:tyrosyl-tRNA synthetase